MDIWYIDIKRFRANNITHRLRWRWPASKTTTSGRGRATVLTDWCHPSAACFAGDSTSTRCQLESSVSRTFHFLILLTKINVIVQFDTRYLRYQSLLSKISKISDIHHIFPFFHLDINIVIRFPYVFWRNPPEFSSPSLEDVPRADSAAVRGGGTFGDVACRDARAGRPAGLVLKWLWYLYFFGGNNGKPN